MTMELPPMRAEDFPKCVGCGIDFMATEPRVIIVLAGSAWHDGRAEIENGAELFRMGAYHEEHAPSASPSAYTEPKEGADDAS